MGGRQGISSLIRGLGTMVVGFHLPVCVITTPLLNLPDLLTTPPGFSNGLDFQARPGVEPDEADIITPPETVSISELLSGGGLLLDWSSKEDEKEEKEKGGKQAGNEGGDGVEVSLWHEHIY